MQYEITLATVPSILTAVIKAHIPASEYPKFIPAACGEVWGFVRSAALPKPGRHVSLYLPSGDIEVGAEVSEPFTGNERVHCSQLPAGRVITTTHFGPYPLLRDGHSQIRQWAAQNNQALSGICWEIYGHWDNAWNSDPSKIRTDIFHLLSDRAE